MHLMWPNFEHIRVMWNKHPEKVCSCVCPVFVALDCQQSVWTGICSERRRVPAVKPNQYRLYSAWRTLCLWHILGELVELFTCTCPISVKALAKSNWMISWQVKFIDHLYDIVTITVKQAFVMWIRLVTLLCWKILMQALHEPCIQTPAKTLYVHIGPLFLTFCRILSVYAGCCFFCFCGDW